VADIKLYGYSTSPLVRKVGCCLCYKQLPFEFVPVNPVDNSQIKFCGRTQCLPDNPLLFPTSKKCRMKKIKSLVSAKIKKEVVSSNDTTEIDILCRGN
jgi:hypothetical protein